LTLVLSVTTPDFVLQVSDRRIVRVGSTGRIASVDDDDATKAVLVLPSPPMTFAYTGLAEIAGTRADVWLMEALGGGITLHERMVALTDRATEAFSKLPRRERAIEHALVGVGWGRLVPGAPLEPFCCTISNRIGADGSRLPTVRRAFGMWCEILRDRPFGFYEAGQPLLPAEKTRLKRVIGQAVARKPSPGPVGRLLGEQVRSVAARNEAVGRGLLLNSLPRPSENGPQDLRVGPPARPHATFLYVPEGATDGSLRPPQLVVGGMKFVDCSVKDIETFIHLEPALPD
jgi:hypothetical protein